MNEAVAWHTICRGIGRDRRSAPCIKSYDHIWTDLVVTFKRPPELTDQPNEDQLSDHGQLGIDNSDECGKDRSERQGRRLSLHDCTSEKASSADEVLVEHFGDDVFDVSDVDLVRDFGHGSRSSQLSDGNTGSLGQPDAAHLVDQTVDTLPQRVPSHPLPLDTALVLFRILLHRPQPARRDVGSPAPSTDEFGKLGSRIEFRLFGHSIVCRPICSSRGLFFQQPFGELSFSFSASERIDIDHSREVDPRCSGRLSGRWNGTTSSGRCIPIVVLFRRPGSSSSSGRRDGSISRQGGNRPVTLQTKLAFLLPCGLRSEAEIQEHTSFSSFDQSHPRRSAWKQAKVISTSWPISYSFRFDFR